jgi:hypothetical protein
VKCSTSASTDGQAAAVDRDGVPARDVVDDARPAHPQANGVALVDELSHLAELFNDAGEHLVPSPPLRVRTLSGQGGRRQRCSTG